MNDYNVKYASHTQVLLQVNTGIHSVNPSTHGALTVMSALQDKLPTVNGEVVPMMAHGDGMVSILNVHIFHNVHGKVDGRFKNS